MARYAKYKDSGAAWIGDIPEEWKTSRLKVHLRRADPLNPGDKQVLSLYRELGVIPKDSRDDNHNVTSEDTSKYKYVRQGDFVVNKMKAWQGSVAVSDYEGIVSPAYYVYHFTDDVFDKRYFHYLMRSCYKEEFMRLSGGIRVGQWDLASADLDNTTVLIPSLDEQKKIAEYLDIKQAEIETLISEAKASIEEYKSWKASIIYEAVTKGLDPNVEMKDSGVEWIGSIPSTWQIRKLKTFTSMISKGSTPSDISNFKSDAYCIRFIKSENIKGNIMSASPEFYITQEVNEELSRSQLTSNDILFVIAGASIGKVALMNSNLLPANTNQANSFLRIKSEFENAIEYLWMVLQSSVVKEVINRYSVQSAQPNISMENLGNIKIPFPPLAIRQSIMEYLNRKTSIIDGILSEKESLIHELEAYKKSLIYEVVTGKRKVV